MPRKITFGCGELNPGARRDPKGRKDPGGGGTLPPVIINDPPYRKEPPVRVPPGEESWICVCDDPCDDDPRACKPGGRTCIQLSNFPGLPAGTPRSILAYSTKAECENKAFKKAPCWICSWDCIEEIVYCPGGTSTGGVGGPNDPIKEIRRHCRRCPNSEFPQCQYFSILDCLNHCQSQRFECPTGSVNRPAPPVGVGPRTGGGTTPASPAGPLTGSGRPRTFPPITPGPRIAPPTGGSGQNLHACVEDMVLEYCPEPNQLSPRRKSRKCVPVPNRSVSARVFTSLQACIASCRELVSICPRTPRDTGTTNQVQVGEAPLRDRSRRSQGPGNSLYGVVNAPPQTTLTPLAQSRVIRRIRVTDLLEEFPSSNATERDDLLFDPRYNIFTFASEDEVVEFVPNRANLDIFKTSIPRELDYALRIAGTQIPWKEFPYFLLTNLKVQLGVRDDLVQAFQTIHTFGGQPTDINWFLETLRRLVLFDRLDDFDSEFILDSARSHANSELTVIERSPVEQQNQRVALGVIAQRGVSMDLSVYNTQEKTQAARYKALLEDINTRVEFHDQEGNLIESLPFGASGAEVLDADGANPCQVHEGIGDGYYIDGDDPDCGIRLGTDVSAAIMPDGTGREQALELLGESMLGRMLVNASVEESLGGSEFEDTFDTTTPSPVMYFALNTSSIVDGERGNQLIDNVEATYTLLNTSDAQEHSRDFGLHVAQVNIDYRDPILVYANETSSFTANWNDVNLRNFEQNRTPGENNIIARSIPFGLVLVASKGTTDTPYHNFSQLNDLETVSRTMKMVAHFNPRKPFALNEQFLFDVDGVYKRGSEGYADSQNVLYYYDPSNFSPITDREAPITFWFRHTLIASLLDNYDLTDNTMTWWDLFSRMTLTQYAELVDTTPTAMFARMETGLFGFSVRSVLNRDESTKSGLTLKTGGTEVPQVMDENDRDELRIYA